MDEFRLTSGLQILTSDLAPISVVKNNAKQSGKLLNAKRSFECCVSTKPIDLCANILTVSRDLNNDAGVNWNNLEVKFTTLLGFLNAPVANGGNGTNLVQQRELQQESYEIGLEAIIEVALSETNMLLQVGDFKGAIVGGLKSLNFVQQLYGSNALEQIEPYFLLAKANQCM